MMMVDQSEESAEISSIVNFLRDNGFRNAEVALVSEIQHRRSITHDPHDAARPAAIAANNQSLRSTANRTREHASQAHSTAVTTDSVHLFGNARLEVSQKDDTGRRYSDSGKFSDSSNIPNPTVSSIAGTEDSYLTDFSAILSHQSAPHVHPVFEKPERGGQEDLIPYTRAVHENSNLGCTRTTLQSLRDSSDAHAGSHDTSFSRTVIIDPVGFAAVELRNASPAAQPSGSPVDQRLHADYFHLWIRNPITTSLGTDSTGAQDPNPFPLEHLSSFNNTTSSTIQSSSIDMDVPTGWAPTASASALPGPSTQQCETLQTSQGLHTAVPLNTDNAELSMSAKGLTQVRGNRRVAMDDSNSLNSYGSEAPDFIVDSLAHHQDVLSNNPVGATQPPVVSDWTAHLESISRASSQSPQPQRGSAPRLSLNSPLGSSQNDHWEFISDVNPQSAHPVDFHDLTPRSTSPPYRPYTYGSNSCQRNSNSPLASPQGPSYNGAILPQLTPSSPHPSHSKPRLALDGNSIPYHPPSEQQAPFTDWNLTSAFGYYGGSTGLQSEHISDPEYDGALSPVLPDASDDHANLMGHLSHTMWQHFKSHITHEVSHTDPMSPALSGTSRRHSVFTATRSHTADVLPSATYSETLPMFLDAEPGDNSDARLANSPSSQGPTFFQQRDDSSVTLQAASLSRSASRHDRVQFDLLSQQPASHISMEFLKPVSTSVTADESIVFHTRPSDTTQIRRSENFPTHRTTPSQDFDQEYAFAAAPLTSAALENLTASLLENILDFPVSKNHSRLTHTHNDVDLGIVPLNHGAWPPLNLHRDADSSSNAHGRWGSSLSENNTSVLTALPSIHKPELTKEDGGEGVALGDVQSGCDMPGHAGWDVGVGNDASSSSPHSFGQVEVDLQQALQVGSKNPLLYATSGGSNSMNMRASGRPLSSDNSVEATQQQKVPPFGLVDNHTMPSQCSESAVPFVFSPAVSASQLENLSESVAEPPTEQTAVSMETRASCLDSVDVSLDVLRTICSDPQTSPNPSKLSCNSTSVQSQAVHESDPTFPRMFGTQSADAVLMAHSQLPPLSSWQKPLVHTQAQVSSGPQLQHSIYMLSGTSQPDCLTPELYQHRILRSTRTRPGPSADEPSRSKSATPAHSWAPSCTSTGVTSEIEAGSPLRSIHTTIDSPHQPHHEQDPASSAFRSPRTPGDIFSNSPDFRSNAFGVPSIQNASTPSTPTYPSLLPTTIQMSELSQRVGSDDLASIDTLLLRHDLSPRPSLMSNLLSEMSTCDEPLDQIARPALQMSGIVTQDWEDESCSDSDCSAALSSDSSVEIYGYSAPSLNLFPASISGQAPGSHRPFIPEGLVMQEFNYFELHGAATWNPPTDECNSSCVNTAATSATQLSSKTSPDTHETSSTQEARDFCVSHASAFDAGGPGLSGGLSSELEGLAVSISNPLGKCDTLSKSDSWRALASVGWQGGSRKSSVDHMEPQQCLRSGSFLEEATSELATLPISSAELETGANSSSSRFESSALVAPPLHSASPMRSQDFISRSQSPALRGSGFLPLDDDPIPVLGNLSPQQNAATSQATLNPGLYVQRYLSLALDEGASLTVSQRDSSPIPNVPHTNASQDTMGTFPSRNFTDGAYTEGFEEGMADLASTAMPIKSDALMRGLCDMNSSTDKAGLIGESDLIVSCPGIPVQSLRSERPLETTDARLDDVNSGRDQASWLQFSTTWSEPIVDDSRSAGIVSVRSEGVPSGRMSISSHASLPHDAFPDAGYSPTKLDLGHLDASVRGSSAPRTAKHYSLGAGSGESQPLLPSTTPFPSVQAPAERRSSPLYSPVSSVHGDEELEVITLRVYHRKNHTGFESSTKLKVASGDVIANRYHVIRPLGSAAFSTAFAAQDAVDGRQVCLKIIKSSKDFFDQSLDEIKLLQYVNAADPGNESGILRLYDFFYYREHLILVTELLELNLYDCQRHLQETRQPAYFTMPRIQSIARQVLKSLAFMHSLNLVHCDCKPENIMIQSFEQCTVKLIDLGSSCFSWDRPGSYIQSRCYRAPEVILNAPYNEKIDIWSLGCILAELASGSVLFQNTSAATMLARIEAVCGPLPTSLLLSGSGSNQFYTRSRELYERKEGGAIHLLCPRRVSLSEVVPGNPLFLDFLETLLTPCPSKRASANAALAHPWLKD